MSEQNQGIDTVRRFLKPMADLLVINAETMGTLIQRQNALVSELVETGVEALRKTVNAQSLQDAFEVQRDYATTVGEKVQNLQRENLETLRDAGTSGSDVLRSAFRPGDEPQAEEGQQAA